MATPDPYKIAFIGTHGVGKTTLCYGLAARLKARDLGCEVVHEVARRCPLPINGDTTVAAQSWILHNQIAEELVAGARYPVVVCDRSVLDNYSYLLLANDRTEPLDSLVGTWIHGYQLLVRVPIVETPRPDGIRSTDPAFQRAIDQILRHELERRGVRALELDPGDREHWIDRVEEVALRDLAPAQLSLLDPPS